MLRAEERGLQLVGHVHDELIAEFEPLEPSDGLFAVACSDLEADMSDPIDWAPGLPLAAEGYECEFYMKG
jgi:DNA polymerase